MSNLVSILLGLVLSILPSDNFQEGQEVVFMACSTSNQSVTAQNIKNLKPEYLISKEELALSVREEQKKINL